MGSFTLEEQISEKLLKYFLNGTFEVSFQAIVK